ncbi:hypothetical protein JCM11251_002982 [Rhodosporidiobolus azoricus]
MLGLLRSVQRRTVSALHRSLSTVRVVAPSSKRELALPLAFVSVKGWDKEGLLGWESWTKAFSQKGYSSLLCEVDPMHAVARLGSPSLILAALERELVRLLQDPAHSSPFPPLLFTHGPSSLLAETYVSSHPLSGLCLVSPTPASSAHAILPHMFQPPLDEFNYEPGFPIAVVDQGGRTAKEHRLAREFAEEEDDEALVRIIDARRDDQGWQEVQDWMDENGL